MKYSSLKAISLSFVFFLGSIFAFSSHLIVAHDVGLPQNTGFKKENNQFRDLIVLLDDGNEVPGLFSGFALTLTFISALSNGEYPILVGSSVWSNFAQRKEDYKSAWYYDGFRWMVDHIAEVNKRIDYWFTSFSKRGYDEQRCKKLVIEKINKEFCSKEAIERLEREDKLPNPNDIERGMADLLCYLTPFDRSSWKVFEVSKDLYLFIPVSYLKNLGINTGSKNAKKAVTPAEQILGLRIDHLKQINPLDPSCFRYEKREEGAFVSALNSIFVNQVNNAWNIYLVGHGINAAVYQCGKTVIANLSLDEFKSFLRFLNTNITTNMFTYTSCFAGGEHLKKAYRSDDKADHFNYPIVVTCLSDSVSFANMVLVNFLSLGGQLRERDIFKNKTTGAWELKLTNELNDWDTFFTGLQKDFRSETKDSSSLFDAIKSIMSSQVSNLPWIRLPQADHFNLLACPHNCTKIDRTLVRSRKASNSVIQFSDPQLENIFLMTSHIAVPIILSDYVCPRFISLIPGDATHTFVKCNSDTGLMGLFGEFFGLFFLCFDKTYIVRDLTCVNDLPDQYKKYVGTSIDNNAVLKDAVIMSKGSRFGELDVLYQTDSADKVYSAKIMLSMWGPVVTSLYPIDYMTPEGYKRYVDELHNKAIATELVQEAYQHRQIHTCGPQNETVDVQLLAGQMIAA